MSEWAQEVRVEGAEEVGMRGEGAHRTKGAVAEVFLLLGFVCFNQSVSHLTLIFLTKNHCGCCYDLVLTPTSQCNFISGSEFLKASLSCRNLVSS